MVQGRTIPEWTGEWWRWLLGLTAEGNPWFDETGERAAVGQTNAVFFLTGIVNESGVATRSITVSDEDWLLFPILNLLGFGTGENPWGTVFDLLYAEGLSSFTTVTGIHVRLDGVSLTDLVYTTGDPVEDLFHHRERSPEFALWTPPSGNVLQYFEFDQAGILDPCISDGYWVMLTPLPLGTHFLEFGGGFGPPANFGLELTYHITVRSVESLRVRALLAELEGLRLSKGQFELLSAQLTAAYRAFDAERGPAGIRRIEQFMRLVRIHLARDDPALVKDLIMKAEAIIQEAKEPPP